MIFLLGCFVFAVGIYCLLISVESLDKEEEVLFGVLATVFMASALAVMLIYVGGVF